MAPDNITVVKFWEAMLPGLHATARRGHEPVGDFFFAGV